MFDTLEFKVCYVTNCDASSSNSPLVVEITEYRGRVKYIIIFNVLKSHSNNNLHQDFINYIFRFMHVNIPAVRVHHLSKESSKPCPVKVVLTDQSDVFELLIMKHKLHGSTTYHQIRINPNQTLSQRN